VKNVSTRNNAACTGFLTVTTEVALILQQFLLGHDVFAAVFEVILENIGFDDRIDRAGFLAKAAVDALEQVDIVARGAARAIGSLLGLDGDRQRRADRLAELAGNAALLAVGIAAERVQTTKPRADRSFLLGVLDGELLAEEITPGDAHALQQFEEQKTLQVVLYLGKHDFTRTRGRF
jgi:hypothetical protein